MPPRFAYWTILIDGKPTAFRATEKEELLPTFNQLRRTNKDVVFKWFARGRIWESPEEARAAAEQRRPIEKRGRDWRPGGEHKDPRARFKKTRDERRSEFRTSTAPRGDRPEPRRDRKPAFGPSGARPSRPWAGPPRTGGREAFRSDKPKDFRADKPKDFRPHPPRDFRPHGAAPPRDPPFDRRRTPPPKPKPRG